MWIVAIVVAFFFLIDPFRLFSGRKIPEIRVTSETLQQYAAFIAETPPADETILRLLDDADVVLIGESGYARQHVQFAAELIPVLHSAGVHRLGYQYANAANQALIDRLVTDLRFDETLAREILFDHLTVFGFEEHVELFRSAWEVNRRRTGAEETFRIIGISTPPVYRAITSQKDVEDPDVMRSVFARGIPDALMAEVIAREFFDTETKAVVYVQAEHAYTGFHQTGYEQQMAQLGFEGEKRTGNILHDRYGNRVASAILHGPVQDTRSRFGFGYPLGNLVEKAYLALPEPRPTAGFRTADSPFADVAVVSDILQKGQNPQLTFGMFADAYLIVAPIRELAAVTPIPDFITVENLASAIEDFPGVSPSDASIEDLNEFIANNAAQMGNVFSEFR